MGERVELCPIPMLTLKKEDKKLFQRYFVFLLGNHKRIMKSWNWILLYPKLKKVINGWETRRTGWCQILEY